MQEGKYVDNYKTNIWGLERIEKKHWKEAGAAGKTSDWIVWKHDKWSLWPL